MKELKVGQELYPVSDGKIYSPIKIERVTKTQAIYKNGRFKKLYNNEYVFAIGSSIWSRTYYYERTEELDKNFKKQQLVYKLKNVNWSEFELDELFEIYKLLK